MCPVPWKRRAQSVFWMISAACLMTLQTSWMPCWSEVAVFVCVVVVLQGKVPQTASCLFPRCWFLYRPSTFSLPGPFRVLSSPHPPPRNTCLTLAQISNDEYLRIVLNRGSMGGGEVRGGTSYWAHPFRHQDQFQNAFAEQITVTTWIEMTAVCILQSTMGEQILSSSETARILPSTSVSHRRPMVNPSHFVVLVFSSCCKCCYYSV